MCCAQVNGSPPSSVVGTTDVSSHCVPTGIVGSMARVSAMAPAAFMPPVPCSNTDGVVGSRSRTGTAVNCRIAFTMFGVSTEEAPSSARLAWITSATTPEATPEAMLVPLRRM
jgi:hypothetical protein